MQQLPPFPDDPGQPSTPGEPRPGQPNEPNTPVEPQPAQPSEAPSEAPPTGPSIDVPAPSSPGTENPTTPISPVG